MSERICHITTVHSPFDTRIFHKECITLVKEGYEVILIAPHPMDEKIKRVQLRGIPVHRNRLKRFFIGNWNVVIKAFSAKARLYHYHDPELFFACLLLRLCGKKIIYDMHEDLPKQVMIKNWMGSKVFRKLISYLVKMLEWFELKMFNAIIVVVPELQNRLGTNKTILLRNFPRKELAESAVPVLKSFPEPVVIYAGGLTKVRGVRELINAVALSKHNLRLWLAGKWESETFRDECKEITGWDRVIELGNLPHEEVYRYMKSSAIGMCTLYETENVKVSLPVKGFEYMACHIPMVMSAIRYWEKIFSGCALFCDPLNAQQIAGCIDQILDDEMLKKNMIAKSDELIANEYSWEVESLKLVRLYKHLLAK